MSKHRLHVLIEPELYQDFTKEIPWGLRASLTAIVIQLIVTAVKADGRMMIGALLAGEYKLVRADKE